MLLLEVISGERDHWPWECWVARTTLAQDKLLSAGFCHLGTAALAPVVLLPRCSWLALGLLKEVGGNVWIQTRRLGLVLVLPLATHMSLNKFLPFCSRILLCKKMVSSSVYSVSLYYPSFTLAAMVFMWACVYCHSVDATEALDHLPAPPFTLQSVIHTTARGSVRPPNMVAWFPGRNLSALPRALSPQPTFLSIACRILHVLPPALFSTSCS